MKTNKILLIAALAVGVFGLDSCSDFMDLKPTTEYTMDQVFSDAAITQAFVNTLYDYAIDGARESDLTGLTDDGYFTHNYGIIAINQGTASPSSLEWYDNGNCPFNWGQAYQGIYYANLILANIDNVPEKTGYDLDVMKGEAHFLRAFMYTDLVRGFGGVPIVSEPVEDYTNTESMQVARSSVDECLKFILDDITIAESLLPDEVTSSNLGRATKWAATALRARINLQIASPLYHDRTVNTLACNQSSTDPATLYAAAAAAAKQVIESGHYSLIDCNAETVEEIASKYHEMMITNNEEFIFAKQFASSKVTNYLNLQHGPNGYHNWAGVTPTQDLVMAFENIDGSLNEGLTTVGEYTTRHIYEGREPRFYADIGYDGCVWGRMRASDGYALDPTPLGNLQMGTYEISDGVDVTVYFPDDDAGNVDKTTLPDGQPKGFTGVYGVDTRQSTIEDWNGSWTGYLEKKLLDTTVPASESTPQVVPYPYLRLAEMYLIVAEADIETGNLDEAVTYLDAIRTRVGMPDTKTTLAVRGQSFNQDDMREFLRHERRIELVYEDSRYYDIRRWMLGSTCGGKHLTGITVVGRLKSGKTASRPYVRDTTVWDYTYYVKNLAHRENRVWLDRMYFAPISLEEINRSGGKMVQNPGYTD